MHYRLFERQESISQTNAQDRFLSIARELQGLDMDKFQACLADEWSLGIVTRDMALASSLGVHGTPTLFINGRRLEGRRDADELRSLVDEAVKNTRPGRIQPRTTVPSADSTR